MMHMFEPLIAKQGDLRLDRRKFLAAAGGLIAAGVLPEAALALARPHMFKHGAYDITVVSDGTLKLPIAMVFIDARPDEVKALLGALVGEGDTASFEASPLLLKSASDLILIDTGSGNGFQPTAGKILDSLKAADSDAGAVTKIVFTHAHPDHCWGTLGSDGAALFPNASLHMAETEWNFWAAPDLAAKMPEQMRPMVARTQAKFAGMKDKVVFFKPGAEILPGIAALDTSGHTPGHVSFEVAGGDGLIVTGDALPNTQVFFPHPEWKFGFDADPDKAIATRKSLLEMAAAGKKKLVGYHWTYPGIGYAEKKGAAYDFVPAA
jgi:glyoxylase-like metal-dependent hydrolase (beta-lactamase superfamily II)